MVHSVRPPRTVIFAAIAVICLSPSSWCAAAGADDPRGSAFVTVGVPIGLDLGLRAGFEYRWATGFGAKVAVGTWILSIVSDIAGRMPWTPVVAVEVLAVMPVCRVGRNGALELLLGLPTIFWGAQPRFPAGVTCSVGGAPRLRFDVGSRVSLSVRVGGGFAFVVDSTGLHAGSATAWSTAFFPDLQLGAAFRL